jgi:hypothetical protein
MNIGAVCVVQPCLVSVVHCRVKVGLFVREGTWAVAAKLTLLGIQRPLPIPISVRMHSGK